MTDYEEWFRGALRDNPDPLSEGGAARRDAMRRTLQGRVVWRGRRRKAARAVPLAAVLIACVLILRTKPVGNGVPPSHQPVVAQFRNLVLEVLRDDPRVLALYAVPPAPLPRETYVDDEELLALLRGAGRPSGLIRVPGRVVLTGKVTDEPGE